MGDAKQKIERSVAEGFLEWREIVHNESGYASTLVLAPSFASLLYWASLRAFVIRQTGFESIQSGGLMLIRSRCRRGSGGSGAGEIGSSRTGLNSVEGEIV